MTDWKYYDDLKLGDKGTTPTVTVTREMIRQFADLTGDHTPVHVDEDFAKKSHFGGIVAHGLFGLALTDGLKCQADLQVSRPARRSAGPGISSGRSMLATRFTARSM